MDKEYLAQCLKIIKTEFYVKLHKISIWDWAVVLGDAYPTHSTTLFEFSIIFLIFP